MIGQSFHSPVIRHEAGHLVVIAALCLPRPRVRISGEEAQLHGLVPAASAEDEALIAVAGALAEGALPGHDPALAARRFVKPWQGSPWNGDLRALKDRVPHRGRALLALAEAAIVRAVPLLTAEALNAEAKRMIAEDEARTARIRAMYAQPL